MPYLTCVGTLRGDGLFDAPRYRLRRRNALSESSDEASAHLRRFLVGVVIEQGHQRILGGDAVEQFAIRIGRGLKRLPWSARRTNGS